MLRVLHKTLSLSVLFAALASASPVSVGPDSVERHIISFKDDLTVERGGAVNVHVEYNILPDAVFGEDDLLFGYGDCGIPHQYAAHHVLGRTKLQGSAQMWPRRFVWIVPDDVPTGGCLHAWKVSEDESEDSVLCGRSGPVSVTHRPSRRSIALNDVGDALGEWFDGVK
jgi:hypothetical protein